MEAIMVCLLPQTVSQLKEVEPPCGNRCYQASMCTEGIIKGNENGGFVSAWMRLSRKMLPYNKEYELKEGKYPEKMQEIAAGRAFL